MVRSQRRQAKGETEGCRTQDDRKNSKRADIPYSNVLIHWKRVTSNVNVEKKLFTLNADEFVMRTIWAVNCLTVRPSAEDTPR